MKTCKVEGCNYRVFGQGLCKKHQYLRSDFKGFKVNIKSPVMKVKHYDFRWGYRSERDMFIDIWAKREHKSFLSGKSIYSPTPTNFAHVLSKAIAKFPKYKYNPNNIILLTMDEHHLLDHGTIALRRKYEEENNCNFNKIYNLYGKLEEEYNKTYTNKDRFIRPG